MVFLQGLSFNSPREKRIAAYLIQFNLFLHHIPGKDNSLADGGSRGLASLPPGEKVKFLPTESDDDIDFIFAINPDSVENVRSGQGTSPFITHDDTAAEQEVKISSCTNIGMSESESMRYNHTATFGPLDTDVASSSSNLFQLQQQNQTMNAILSAKLGLQNTPNVQSHIPSAPTSNSTQVTQSQLISKSAYSNATVSTGKSRTNSPTPTMQVNSTVQQYQCIPTPTTELITQGYTSNQSITTTPPTTAAVNHSLTNLQVTRNLPAVVSSMDSFSHSALSSQHTEHTVTPLLNPPTSSQQSTATNSLQQAGCPKYVSTYTLHLSTPPSVNQSDQPDTRTHTNTVMAVRRRRKKKQINSHSLTAPAAAADNSDQHTDDVNADLQCNSTDPVQSSETETQPDKKYMTYTPSITDEDYKNDDEFCNIFSYLHDGTLTGDPQTDRLLILPSEDFIIDNDGLLYRITQPRNSKNSDNPENLLKRLCLPLRVRNHTFSIMHDLTSHAGRERLYLAMKRRFYYKRLYSDCLTYATTCQRCLENKRNYSHITRPLNSLETPQFFGQRWHMDHLSLPRQSENGEVSILVFTEALTRYPVIRPVKSEAALHTAITFLSSVVATFGLHPETTIVTDRSRTFTSNFFRHLADLLGVKLLTSATSASRTNGAAEALVKKTKEGLKFYCENDLQLSVAIPLVEMGLRASISTAHGFSPHQLVFSTEFPLPIIKDANVPLRFTGDYKEYLLTLTTKLSDLRELAIENLEKTKIQNQKQYNRRHHTKDFTFTVGTPVLLENRRIRDQSKVLSKERYQPGFVITKVVQGLGFGPAYELTSTATGRPLQSLIAHDRLKLDTSLKRQDFNTTNPPLDDTNTQFVTDTTTQTNNTTPISQPDDNIQDDNSRPTTNSQQTDGKDTNAHMHPAVRVLRQKGSGRNKKYYVLFENGERAWCTELSPALLNAWLVIRAAQITRRRRRKKRS